MKYCEKCGKPIKDGDMFCEACGYKISVVKNDSPTPQPTPQPTMPQEVSQPNAFRDFSEQVNTEQVQKRTGSRGLLWGGIIALVFVTILIMVAAVVIRTLSSKTEDLVSSVSEDEFFNDEVFTSESSNLINEPLNALTPQNIKTNATLETVAGMWEGEFRFTRIEGFDSLPPEELPPDFEEIIERILSEASYMEMEIEPDGNWDLSIEVELGMMFSSYDYDRDLYASSPLLIKEVKDGHFQVDHIEEQELDGTMAKMRFFIDGYVIEDDGGSSLQGTVLFEMEQGDVHAFQEGTFILYPTTE